jgi:SAM-dependent methyltransferase
MLCDLCESEVRRLLVRCSIEETDTDLPLQSMDIVKCQHCGLVYVNPQPVFSDEALHLLYSKNYFEAPYMKYYADEGDIQSNESFEQRMALIEKFANGGKLLDIGCASGGFLNLAKNKGWDTYGVDVSESAVLRARERYDLEVFQGSLQDALYDDEFFDVVSLGDVFEHVKNPKLYLKEVYRILKKGGLLYLAVPNFDGLYYKIALLVSRFNGRNYFVLPYHIYFFTEYIIDQYLNKTDFELIKFKRAESRIIKRNLFGFLLKILFGIAHLLKMQDRLICLAKKA